MKSFAAVVQSRLLVVVKKSVCPTQVSTLINNQLREDIMKRGVVFRHATGVAAMHI